MNKKEFLSELKHGLRKFDDDEVKDVLAYYDELISDMCDNGMTEKRAVASFGELKTVLSRIKGEMLEKPSQRKVWTTTAIIFGALLSPVLLPVLLCALIIYITYAIVAFSLVVGFGVGGIASIIYGIIMFFAVIGSNGFGAALTYLGGGLVAGCVLCLLTIGIYKLGISILKAINGMVIRGINKKHRNKEGKK